MNFNKFDIPNYQKIKPLKLSKMKKTILQPPINEFSLFESGESFNNTFSITLKKYPKEEFCIFELPVKINKDGDYQVWNGLGWINLKIKKI